ncbi:hypothetical protein QCA50_001285 [Cerrena zonata]|uniref:HMG box domain-containing protein n=1 Tax=Cerrena zonata TaxID=2478898 RepID=A0AAW0H092_9APHY
MARAQEVAARFPGTTVQHFHRQFHQIGRLQLKKCSPNPWNAFMRQARAQNNAFPPGERMTLTELSKDASERWKLIPPQDRIQTVNVEMSELQEKRAMRSKTAYNHPKQVFQDCQATLQGVRDVDLHGRTGVEVLLFTSRGHVRDWANAAVFSTNTRLQDFFKISTSLSVDDFAYHMEGFCIGGVAGAASSYATEILNLKQQVKTLINEGLAAIVSPRKAPRMVYINFKQNISHVHNIVIEGWPLDQFRSPGDFSNHDQLQQLYNAWSDGKAYWRHLTPAEITLREASDRALREQEEAARNQATLDSTLSSSLLPTPSSSLSSTPAMPPSEMLVPSQDSSVGPSPIPASVPSSGGVTFQSVLAVNGSGMIEMRTTTRGKRSGAGEKRKKSGDSAPNKKKKAKTSTQTSMTTSLTSANVAETIPPTTSPLAGSAPTHPQTSVVPRFTSASSHLLSSTSTQFVSYQCPPLPFDTPSPPPSLAPTFVSQPVVPLHGVASSGPVTSGTFSVFKL